MSLSKKLAAFAVLLPLLAAGNVFAADVVQDKSEKQVKAEKDVAVKANISKHPERMKLVARRQPYIGSQPAWIHPMLPQRNCSPHTFCAEWDAQGKCTFRDVYFPCS